MIENKAGFLGLVLVLGNDDEHESVLCLCSIVCVLGIGY